MAAGGGCTLEIPALLRQTGLCEIEASLVYITSFRAARATQRDRFLKQKGENYVA